MYNLRIERFVAEKFELPALAARLTALKALASRTPTPVTVEQLSAISKSRGTGFLLLQLAGAGWDAQTVVGMVHVAIIHLEDRAHLGPICVDTEGSVRGHGTALMESAILLVRNNFPGVRRIDLSNRPSHDLEKWYRGFGFQPRTQQYGDPTTVYRLNIER